MARRVQSLSGREQTNALSVRVAVVPGRLSKVTRRTFLVCPRALEMHVSPAGE